MFPLTRDRSRNRSAFGYRPTLNLIFGPNSGDTLDPRITFSRTSNATQFDSAGNLVYAPHNLLTFSEQFDASPFAKVNTAITANAEVAPNGTTTADLMSGNAGTSTKYVFNQFSISSPGAYTASVYVKAGTENFVVVRITDNTGGNGARQRFNVATGAKDGGVAVEGTATNSSSEITAVGNGWYRCSITTTFNSALTLVQANFWLNSYASVSLTTNLLFWGAQLNIGTLQPYYPTTVKNLLGYTQEFDNAAWTKSNSTITANATAAPDGSVTGDKLVETTAASATHLTQQTFTSVSGAIYTASVYVKAGERGEFALQLVGGFTGTQVRVNLLTGAVINTSGSPISSGAVSVGNGWYRVYLSQIATSTASSTYVSYISVGGTTVYTGDGTSGIFIWGAQLSDSASLDPYVYNPVAAPTAAAYYGPRFDYDPSTLAARGLLIEEQRTNSIRNNSMVGAVAGTPGTAPTNWVVSTGAGITRQLVEVGVENGIAYIDYRFSGTGSVVNDTQFDVGNFIAAASGQVWTHAAYCRLVAGSLTNVTVTQILAENSAAGAFLAASTQNITPTSAALGTQRYALTRTLNNASTAFTVPTLRVTSAGAIDVTVRIGLPQLELGAFATSVIPTTTAAATRTADVATMVGANFSNWYNPTAGTLCAESRQSVSTTSVLFPRIASVNDNTSNNEMAVLWSTGIDRLLSVAVSSGVFQADIGYLAQTQTALQKTAFAYQANDFAFSANAQTVQTDTSGTVPTVNRMSIGNLAGSNNLNGYIRRIAYFPTRLSNAQLQAVTA